MSGSMPIPDVAKRPRDEMTDAIIKQAMEHEQERKKVKHGGEIGTVHRPAMPHIAMHCIICWCRMQRLLPFMYDMRTCLA